MKPDKPKPAKKPNPSASQRTIADYEQQIGELTVHLQRLQAEFENYKKRVGVESTELMSSAKESILAELLPILDNLELAASHLPKALEQDAWARGMQYIGSQLSGKLEELDVHKLNPLGDKFDHNRDEAVEYVDSDKPEGTITEVLAPGYQIGDKIVRHARVKVSQGNKKE